MATYCLQCSAKIGLFKRPVEGLYCSVQCRDGAAEEQAQREAQARQRPEEQKAAGAAVQQPPPQPGPAPSGQAHAEPVPARSSSVPPAWSEQTRSGVVARTSGGTDACPKCASPWNTTPGGGSLGRDRGECPWCGYAADYIAIGHCDNCRCRSLIVLSADEARCAKCKSRPRRRRIA